jgi:small subunit ribosomal protein S9
MATKDKYHYGLGRRKAAIAKVRLYEGSKDFIINGKPASEYIANTLIEPKMFESLKAVGRDKDFGFTVVARGGGLNAQAEAIRLGISKALLEVDPGYRTTLKGLGFMSRDPRSKERMKPGKHGARRTPQFSKR